MKDISEVTALVVDAGTFMPLGSMLAKKCKETYYFSPWEQEFIGLERACIGDGMPDFQRVDDFMEPGVFDKVDLWVFPDLGYGGLQRYLRQQGKAVWGNMGASDLEWYRTKFLKMVQEVGLPTVNSVICRGVTELAEYLKGVQDKWVKINRYRDDMETWHHQDYDHSQRELERLAMTFGGMKEHVVFVVQDAINSEDDSPVVEVGFDGWVVDSEFPVKSYYGLEAKDSAYLGSLLDYEDLPEAVRTVNQALAPIFKQYGYRCFFASEIRVKDGVPYFTDGTFRMAGQTMEHTLSTCTNLAEVIWHGANGELIAPEFSHPFAAESTLHYKGDSECWKTMRVPEEVKDKVMLYRCCFDGEAYQFPPGSNDEVGVVIGQGNTIEESIDDLKENFAMLSDEPVSINEHSFVELLEEIAEGEAEGVEFSDQPVPKPETVLQ